MFKLDNTNKNDNLLLRNIPIQPQNKSFKNSSNASIDFSEKYDVKINLESIHYSGKDYGYGWTFVISTLNRHWISKCIHIQRGRKSVVNKDIYHHTVKTSFYALQHLPITICAQHLGGFKLETTLRLKPSLFRMNLLPTSIYTEIGTQDEGFCFHELHRVTHEGVQLMFVLNFEITPKESAGYRN